MTLTLSTFASAALAAALLVQAENAAPSRPEDAPAAAPSAPSAEPAPETPQAQPPAAPGDEKKAPPADDLSRQLDEVLSGKAPAPASRPASSNNLLNPDISVITDATGGYATRALRLPSGDDPNLGGSEDDYAAGITLQEIELSFQAAVDPYFRAAAFLTIPNLEGIEVEEAYATTTSLPAGLQVRAGVIRSSAGRQNEQHLHAQDFVVRPLINAAYLGEDGLRGPGVQLSWLAPTPFFLRIAAEAFSLGEDAGPTFGGRGPTVPAVVGVIETSADLTESTTLVLGGTVASGSRPRYGGGESSSAPHTLLAGGDLYLRWRPANVAETYWALAFQAEYFVRRTSGVSGLDGGGYAQLVARLARRWYAGARYDHVGLPTSAVQGRAARAGLVGAFAPTEFSRLRLQLAREIDANGDESAWAALLQLEYAIGPHGAHAF